MTTRFIEELVTPVEGVYVETSTDRFQGDEMQTACLIRGNFVIKGEKRDEFFDKLNALFNEYKV